MLTGSPRAAGPPCLPDEGSLLCLSATVKNEGGRLSAATLGSVSRLSATSQSMVNSVVCGLRWSSFLAPATALSLRFQMMRPRVMSDS